MKYRVKVRGRELHVAVLSRSSTSIEFQIENQRYAVQIEPEGTQALPETIFNSPSVVHQTTPSPPPNSSNEIKSPMAGIVAHALVRPGDAVAQGDVVMVIEAMKMENNITAHRGGAIAEVLVSPGSRVNGGDVLIRFT